MTGCQFCWNSWWRFDYLSSCHGNPRKDTTTDPAKIAGVDPKFDVEPTAVDVDTDAWAMDTDVPVDNNAIAIDGLKQ